MKFLYLIFFIGLVTSCSGTKNVVAPNKTATPTTINKTKKTDSIKPKITEVIVDTVPSERHIEIIEEPIIEYHPSSSTKVFNHEIFDSLLIAHVSTNGNVNYKGFKSYRDNLKKYIASLSKNSPKAHWPKEEKLAYWINAYNAMTIDLILRHYPVKSIKDIKDPWKLRYWKLGNKWYNLDEIEHSILRKMDEPRIHFAINCASVSCPKLSNRAYSASNLKTQLTKATKDFLNDATKNNISKEKLELSKIFQWFAKDFKQNGNLIDFLNQHSDIEISAKAKKSFKDYNWGLNE